MIELTNNLDEKIIVNHKKIIEVDEGPGNTSVLIMDSGSKITTKETSQQIEKKAREYQVNVIAEAVVQALSQLGVNISGK